MAKGRSAADTGGHKRVATACPCGGAVLASGRCAETGDFPAWLAASPFACPHCRKPLGWDGGCAFCRGCTSASREDWTFPGDRYELAGAHWRQVAVGPRPACTLAENAAALHGIARLLGQTLAVSTTPDDWADLEWEPGENG